MGPMGPLCVASAAERPLLLVVHGMVRCYRIRNASTTAWALYSFQAFEGYLACLCLVACSLLPETMYLRHVYAGRDAAHCVSLNRGL